MNITIAVIGILICVVLIFTINSYDKIDFRGKTTEKSSEPIIKPHVPLNLELQLAEDIIESDNIKIFEEEVENTNSEYCKQLLRKYISEIKSYNFDDRNPFNKLQVDIKNNNNQLLQSLEFDSIPTAGTRYFYDNSGFLRLSYHYYGEKINEIRELILYETLANQNNRKLTFYYDRCEEKFRLGGVEEETLEKKKLFSYEYYDDSGDYRLTIRKYNDDNSFIELNEGFDRWYYCYRDLIKFDSSGRKINKKSYTNYTQKLSDDKLKSETEYFYDKRGNEIEEKTHNYETNKTEKYIREFDNQNNLIHEILNDGFENFYKYDSNNNLIYKKDRFHELHYTYDKNNRLIIKKKNEEGKISKTRYIHKEDGTVLLEFVDNEKCTKQRTMSEHLSEVFTHTFKTCDKKMEVNLKLTLNEIGPMDLP